MFDIADKNKPVVAKALVYGAFLCVLLAAFGSLGTDIILASTQWLLVAITLSVWGVYILVEAHLRNRN